MLQHVHLLIYLIMFSPLVGAIIAGLFGRWLTRKAAHVVTVMGMLICTFCAFLLGYFILSSPQHVFSFTLYTWAVSGGFSFHVGFLVDQLTAVMLATVTFVSLLVHIYSIGYMHDDAGYKRFFCYMSLFTFFMLMLASANNFLQLFFGWEGVGLVSYLLIGFWFTKDSAVSGGLKAFVVNRVGDFGLAVGIALIFAHVGSLDYAQVFSYLPHLTQQTISIIPGHPWSLMTVICIFLFIGAMGKSAQLPLHIWLPESMEGPTPISALIHAATMVTAGIFMVARLSPLYELSATSLSLVMIVGASGALFLGLLAVVENDIKRVIAFSTMSQLGYMMAANGASAFHAAIFHLMTHACFKALLFLGAGSVIVAMHHEQDLRLMGGLRKYLPWTYVMFLVGSLALAAVPPFSGFYSKDVIITAVAYSHLPGASYAHDCLLIGAFVTSWYTFRAFFMAFHGKERMSDAVRKHLHEPAWSMRLPLLFLAIPSLLLGLLLAGPMIYSKVALLGGATYTAPQYDLTPLLMTEPHTVWSLVITAFHEAPFWFSTSGIAYAYVMYLLCPELPGKLMKYTRFFYVVLRMQYGFDLFNDWVIIRGTKRLSGFFYRTTDLKMIDGLMVNGSGSSVVWLSRMLRYFQSGYLYHYVLVMLLGVLAFLGWLMFGH